MNETDLFMLAWTTASIIQLILLPGKFFEANYYYIPALIPVFYYAGLGLPIRGRTFYISGAILFCALALLFPVKVLYFVPDAEKTVSAAGSAVYSLTGAHDKVVAESGDSPALLYYTHRSGWVYSAVSKDEQHHFFEDAINYGATMFATTNPGKWKTGEASDLIGDYAEILTSSDDFSIYRFRSAAHD
ncbi:MAG: hypothetical protein KC649_00480 [Candidatus Omnitrophica bacterium]|nr:hypothetical protein [Candidatus Omnitrophota bacterium]